MTCDFQEIGDFGERKQNTQTPVFSLKIKFLRYLVGNSQRAISNFYFKSRSSVKLSKFPIHFVHDFSIVSDSNHTKYLS